MKKLLAFLIICLAALLTALFNYDACVRLAGDIGSSVYSMVERRLPTFAAAEQQPPSKPEGKRVYAPPRPAAQQVEAEARPIGQSPPPAAPAEEQSWEQLSFDAEFYPFYHMLSPAQQLVYRQVYSHALKLEAEMTLPKPISEQQLSDVMTALYSDHPQLFWLDTRYGYGFREKGTALSVTLFFNDTAGNFSYCQAKFDEAVENILSAASALPTDFQKEKYVHDYLLANVSYSESAPLHQSAYSALVNGESVCAGYSRAFQLIMQKLDIPSYYCSGVADGVDHAWNIVRLDGGYYNVDLSWNDPINAPEGYYCSDYLNVPDSFIAESHRRDGLSRSLPECL